MLEWVYDDKSRGRGSEASVGLVMAEASVEEGENRVVCGIYRGLIARRDKPSELLHSRRVALRTHGCNCDCDCDFDCDCECDNAGKGGVRLSDIKML